MYVCIDMYIYIYIYMFTYIYVYVYRYASLSLSLFLSLSLSFSLSLFIRKQVFFIQKRVLGWDGSNDHAKLKSENGSEKQNQKLVLEYGFRVSTRTLEQAEQKN